MTTKKIMNMNDHNNIDDILFNLLNKEMLV